MSISRAELIAEAKRIATDMGIEAVVDRITELLDVPLDGNRKYEVPFERYVISHYEQDGETVAVEISCVDCSNPDALYRWNYDVGYPQVDPDLSDFVRVARDHGTRAHARDHVTP